MIQLYISKKNFDAQKAERFFKERRVQVQVMDLKKHKLGERELQGLSLFYRKLAERWRRTWGCRGFLTARTSARRSIPRAIAISTA